MSLYIFEGIRLLNRWRTENSIYEEPKVNFLKYQISENIIEPLTKRSESIINKINRQQRKN